MPFLPSKINTRFLYLIRSLTSKLLPAIVSLVLLTIAALYLCGAPQENRRRGSEDQDARKYPEIPGHAEKSARALAVMVWLGDAKKITNPRLIPLSIYYKNQFNDANTYMADPYPLALTDGTIYEVQSHGAREGFFKVGLIHRIKADWIGLGQWMTEAEVAAMKKTRAKRTTHSAEDDRPIMRRNASGSGSGGGGTKEQVNPEEDNPDLADAMSTDEDRPTLQRSKSNSNTGSGNAGSGTAAGSGQSATIVAEDNAADLAQELSTDVNRPSLKHNAGPQRPDTDKMEVHNVATRKPQDEDDVSASSIPLHLMVAVSDAGAQDSHSYDFKWNAGEEDKYRKLLTGMAIKDLASGQPALAAETPNRKTGHTKSGMEAIHKPAPQPELQDVRMQAFDLAFNNTPVIVFSAAQKAPDSTLVRYVTLVTRTDAVGQTDQIFSSITASDRLDVTPRLLLVDAVDGYGSGRGDLLFQQISDSGTNFVLYRAERGNLAKVFEGGDLPGVAAAQ